MGTLNKEIHTPRQCGGRGRAGRTRSCWAWRSTGHWVTRSTAADTASMMARGSGSARMHMSCGSTSGTPPTFVLVTRSPADAASRIAMQNASVRLVFKKISPAATRVTSSTNARSGNTQAGALRPSRGAPSHHRPGSCSIPARNSTKESRTLDEEVSDGLVADSSDELYSAA